jgi:hypothetical protein
MILALLVRPRDREPEYNGVPLSTWLKGYGNPQATYSDDSLEALLKARSAVCHIGTNALPFFLRWIQYEQPGWRRSFNHAVWKLLPPALQYNRTTRWLLADRAWDRANSAVAGFAFLGTNAAPALPELQRLHKNSNKPGTQYHAEMALMFVDQRVLIDDFNEEFQR